MRIDSSLVIVVLGQKFNIRVMEETGGVIGGNTRCCGGCVIIDGEAPSMASHDGGVSFLATAVGGSEVGSECDPSQSCQVLMGLEKQACGKGEVNSTWKDGCQEVGVIGSSSNNSGNSPSLAIPLVNVEDRCVLSGYEENRVQKLESAGSGGERRIKSTNTSPIGTCADLPSRVPCFVLSREQEVGSGAVCGVSGSNGVMLQEMLVVMGLLF
ncbi:hypothetical protein TSUD_54150 [Trifolium subterraneum]|uniref:Uncharacterized protein n=1 Tax=Trifolium subterraneum TaxID=3900 RepID=A0A2Z6MIP6_TRISU|nr:hypothetical protein TSUD_54150 [Trifolium subterraneum]